ncbi:MAG TPA: hypothetical protein DCX06_07800 [Opitutae bacterium]|nr:hypothetical protein [Opitutae bacterium]
MQNQIRLFTTAIGLLFGCIAHGQYEQLVNDPEALKAVVDNGGFVTKEKPPESRTLSTPAPHTRWVRGMEVSSDDEFFLSYDSLSLKIWDTKRRVVIKNYSPETDILKAHFINDENTVCIVTESGLSFYTDFEFGSKESTEQVKLSGIADAAYDAENQIIYLAQETSDTYAQVTSYDIAAKTSKNIYKSDFREFLIHKNPNRYDDHVRRITYSAKYKMLALNFAYRGVFKLIDLRTGEALSDIPQAKQPYGFLPNGELLSVTKSPKDMLISYINPVTHELNTVARFPLSSKYDNATVYMPHNVGNMLIVRGFETTAILDPRTNQIITQSKPAELTTAAFPLEGSNTVIMGQSLTGNFGDSHISLNQYTAKDGALVRSWGAAGFIPRSLYPRSDAFEFLIQHEYETRRVKITDNSLSSEVVPTPKGFYLGRAYYNTNKNRWMLGDYKDSKYLEFNPDSKFDTLESVETNTDSFFSQIQFFDQTSDGTLLAFHGRTGVAVYDPINQSTRLGTKLETSGGYAFGKAQMIAISPEGRNLAYVYQNNSPKENTWHLVCQEISTGKTLWTNPYSIENEVIDHLKFSEDGNLLYIKRKAGLYALFAMTGEVFRNYDLSEYGLYHYNKAGTLAVTWRRNSIRIIALPSGETLADLPNDHLYDQLQFIGNDNFLIGSDRNLASISLFSIKEGKKIAQMYLFDDPNRWLVRDPQTGLFASDQTSQEHLYFVQGKQVSPLAAYFDDFYRPRLLGSLIKGLTLESPIDLADLKRAPRVNMAIAGVSQRGLSVEDEFESFEIEDSKVTLEITATGEGSPIEDIRIYHNGKLVSGAARGLFVEDDDEWDQSDEEIFTKNSRETFELTPGKNRFRVIAINEQGTESIPDELAVSSINAPEVAEGGIAMHMLTIGINKYRNPDYNLNYALADAKAVEATLSKNYDSIFTRVERYQLFDAEATRENIIATLELIKQEAGPRDVFIFYYAGHGIMSDDNEPQFYLAPYETTQLYGDRNSLREAAVSSDELLKYSRDILAQKQLFILDACQSAGALKTVAVRGASEEKAIAQLARSTGTHWLTATGSEQFATEFDQLGHGAFTYTLLEALKGAADSGDGIVSVNELKAYIEAKVPEVTEQYKGEAQYPASYGYGQDFPLAIP